MLTDICYKPSYSKGIDDIASVFYNPSMKYATTYDRVSGYFGSTIFIISWGALKPFIENKGKMRLICSPVLTDEDCAAMQKGYEAQSDEIVRNAVMREVADIFNHENLSVPYKLLAYMIAEGIIDVRIATVGESAASHIRRLFHDKVGVFGDQAGNYVGFRGSMNETFQGLSPAGNIESIDVFPSWVDQRDRIRVTEAQSQFEALWNGTLHNVRVMAFPEAAQTIMREKACGAKWEELLEEVRISENLADKWCADTRYGEKHPRPHQYKALEAWVQNDRKGIFEHATGSGKTYTAMCAIRHELDRGKSVLVMVPSIDLLNQWYDELQENLYVPGLNYLLCGGGHNEWKKNDMLTRWTQKHPDEKTIVLATMDTASSKAFLSMVSGGNHLFVVADEVHRLGSAQRQKVFQIESGSCLALSATPRRYGDPTGTAAIFNYFGGIIPPPFTLSDAINAQVLTRYFYHPHTVKLTHTEQEDWDVLTKEISRLVVRAASKDSDGLFGSPAIKRKLLARARILKNAAAKVHTALSIIAANYQSGQRWIVYCDNQTQLQNVLTLLLRNGYDAYEYHSEMKGDREQTLEYFASCGGILVSIRCLDEGVDIPTATHALILASSKNPREFIQRRGRILRKAPNKHYAHLYDVMVLPNPCEESNEEKILDIVTSELARAIQFGEMAENPSCIATLKNIAVDFDIDIDTAKEGGFEDETE